MLHQQVWRQVTSTPSFLYTTASARLLNACRISRTVAIIEIILIGFTLMIFGIPFLLGIATFFIFIFGGFSAIVGTHGGKELDPEGAEILFLASHPRYRPSETAPSAATDSPEDSTAPTSVATEPKLAALLPLRRNQDSDSEASL